MSKIQNALSTWELKSLPNACVEMVNSMTIMLDNADLHHSVNKVSII